MGWIRPWWSSRRSFDPLGPVVLFWVHCCWGSKPACSNRLQVSGRMLLRPSSPAGVSRNELHFSLSACFRLCGVSCVVGLVVCEQSRAAGRLPGICPSSPGAVSWSLYFVYAKTRKSQIANRKSSRSSPLYALLTPLWVLGENLSKSTYLLHRQVVDL